MRTPYPTDAARPPPAPASLDIGAIMRVALRAPMIGEPLSLHASTLVSRLDGLLERGPLERLLLVAHALAEVARADPGAAGIVRASGLARQIRAEVDLRKAGRSAAQVPAIVRREQGAQQQEAGGG